MSILRAVVGSWDVLVRSRRWGRGWYRGCYRGYGRSQLRYCTDGRLLQVESWRCVRGVSERALCAHERRPMSPEDVVTGHLARRGREREDVAVSARSLRIESRKVQGSHYVPYSRFY